MAKPRILIVEDEFITVQDIQSSLDRLDHTVCGVAGSGEQAIQLAGELRPDVILMDVVLKGDMDGIETAGHIVSRYDIPVIYLSACADAGALERARISESHGYLLKPFRDRELDANIHMALYKAEMKRKVKEAEEVIDLNEFLRKEIARREMAESRLDDTARQLRVLSSRLLDAQERERKRLADEIHDSIGSSLAAIKFSLEETVVNLNRDRNGVLESMQKVIAMVQGAIEESRRISSNLRPSLIDDLGLMPTIRWLAEEFQKVYTDLAVQLQLEIEEEAIAEALKIVIYRIIQESLNNAAKYSEADTVRIELTLEGERIHLIVADDGVGCDLGKLDDDDRPSGMGLRSMQERAHFSGGRFEIRSVPGDGMKIRASWPAKTAPPDGSR
jgi:signal transduction histidine kinase